MIPFFVLGLPVQTERVLREDPAPGIIPSGVNNETK